MYPGKAWITPLMESSSECLLFFDLGIVMKIYTDQFLREKILGIQEQPFEKLTIKKQEWYVCFEIPKKDGMREICALAGGETGERVEKLQKNLLNRFLRRIPIAVCAKGFVREESYQSFLEPHAGNRYFMRLDIRNFFSSFTPELIRQGLGEFVEDKKALEMIYELCTWKDTLPQGAVTSPALSNVLFRRADQRILKYCQMITERSVKNRGRKANTDENEGHRITRDTLCYTRYADDMLFSSDFFDFSDEKYFIKMISRILKENGFELNRSKTVISKGQIALNGYMVGESVWLSRKKLQDLKRILYFFGKKNSEEYRLDKGKVKGVYDSLNELNHFLEENHFGREKIGDARALINYLAGCRSWLIAILRMRSIDDRTRRQLGKIRERIEMLLWELNKQEEKRKGI